MFNLITNGNKSAVRRKDFQRSTAQSLHKHSQSTLGNGDIANAVKLPKGEKLEEWLAVHVVDFYNCATLIYDQISECTDLNCPKMSAGKAFDFLFRCDLDPKTGKKNKTQKPENLPAHQYIKRSFEWMQELLDNESIFPTNSDVSFPKNFQKVVKAIFKKLLRIYAHLLFDHFKQITALGLDAHVNSSVKHFLYFTIEFNLLTKADLEPLEDFVKNRLGVEQWNKLKTK
jgi:MOB kinase activator 1